MQIPPRESAPASGASQAGSERIEPRIKLILVDDDDDYRTAACNELDYLGFDVVALPSGEALFETLPHETGVEMIVLDWKLPSGLGIDLLRPLRASGCELPVIFLTAIPATAYESAAFDGGAVDFVDKARGITILAKRIRASVAMARKIPQTEPRETLQCGRLLLRPEVCAAFWKDTDLALTVTEFNILYLLASRAGDYATYRAIYDCVHSAGFAAGDGEDGYRTNVRSSIKRIRNKFRAIDAEFSEIENFAAFGYRWKTAPDTLL
jgi:two-component system, OmpR family, response regulator ChvI